MESDPKTRREKKGGKKDKGPYSAKHVRLVAAASGAAASKAVVPVAGATIPVAGATIPVAGATKKR
jgi:hypothetical protein